MPYKIVPLKGGKFSVHSPKHTLARSTTKSKAKKQIRLLLAVEHGWKPSKKKKA